MIPSTSDDLLDIRTALADLAEAPKAIRESARATAAELGGPLADLVKAMERSPELMARAVGEAFARTLSQALAVQARERPPEVIHAAPAAGWVFTPDYYPNGALKQLRATRIESE